MQIQACRLIAYFCFVARYHSVLQPISNIDIKMMWQAILLVMVFILILFVLWLPKYLNRKHQPISITTRTAHKFTLEQYRQYQKGKPIPDISLVVPSYNEEYRLAIMLADVAKYFRQKQFTNQIIIANDGSKDKTTEVALAQADKLNLNLVVMQSPKNRGKGGAVKAGMALAEGHYVLMVDADGATTFSQLDKVWHKLKEIQITYANPLVMVVGSRRHLEEQGKVQRKFHRKLVSAVFKIIITIILGIKTRDTQCGFKLFTKVSAAMLFKALHIDRFAFDVELFFLCNQLSIKTAEVGVEWRDVDGSKLTVMDASVNMLRDVLMIRLLYLLGVWKKTDIVEIE